LVALGFLQVSVQERKESGDKSPHSKAMTSGGMAPRSNEWIDG
jgi:hypothetical protein